MPQVVEIFSKISGLETYWETLAANKGSQSRFMADAAKFIVDRGLVKNKTVDQVRSANISLGVKMAKV
jgi:hypothetical protein